MVTLVPGAGDDVRASAASWRSPTSSSSTRPIGTALIGRPRRLTRCCRSDPGTPASETAGPGTEATAGKVPGWRRGSRSSGPRRERLAGRRRTRLQWGCVKSSAGSSCNASRRTCWSPVPSIDWWTGSPRGNSIYAAAAEILRRAGAATPPPWTTSAWPHGTPCPRSSSFVVCSGSRPTPPRPSVCTRSDSSIPGTARLSSWPLTADAPVARFLDKHSAGVHHVCLRVGHPGVECCGSSRAVSG